MAIEVRKGSDAVKAALVSQHNALLQKVAATLTTEPHADITSTTSGDFSAPVATPLTVPTAAVNTLPKVVARANVLKLYFNTHLADAVAHKAADATNPVTTADATDQGTANTLLNAIQSAFNAHLTQSGVHYTNDTTNPDSTTVASDLGTSETLATNLTTAFNAHIQMALGNLAVKLISA